MTPQERGNQAEPNVVNTSPNLLSYGGLASLAGLNKRCDSDCERSRPASIR
jgi:hypothetical protein